MNDIIKETIKKYFSNKTKEELLDMAADLFITVMTTNVMRSMTNANMQYVNKQQQKALMDAINGDCSEITEFVKNSINISASPLTAKIREKGI